MKNLKVKVLIVEDDTLWAMFVESIIEMQKEFQLIGIAATINQAREMIKITRPNLLICDVMLNDLSIFNLFDNGELNDIPTVFMTNQLNIQNFESAQLVEKSAFLAKPFHKFTFLSTLDLLIKKYPIEASTSKFLEVRNKHLQIIKLKYDDILWIQAEGNYSVINTIGNKKFVRKKSLSQILLGLDERFIQVQKAYVINKDYVARIDINKQNVIIDDVHIPIGRKYRPTIDMLVEEREFLNK